MASVASKPALPGAVPRHIAIIMDGNGRWARQRALPRLEGHQAGATAVRRAVDACLAMGVRYLTLFSFSTENWQRSPEEVSGLMKLFEDLFSKHLPDLIEKDIRLRMIGDSEGLPEAVRSSLLRDIEMTENCSSLDLVLAMNYGAREEIVRVSRKLAEKAAAGELSPDEIDEEVFRAELWTGDVPDPDLLIRTSGEMRISNFLLWQIAYSELVVVPELWPEFDEDILRGCIAEFGGRERRFGMTSEQVRRRSRRAETPAVNGVPAST